jgi:hypothetical protein
MNPESTPYHIDPKGFETFGNAIGGWFDTAAKPFEKHANSIKEAAKRNSEHLSSAQFPEPTAPKQTKVKTPKPPKTNTSDWYARSSTKSKRQTPSKNFNLKRG